MSPENKSGKGNRYYSGTKVDKPTILFSTSKNACERPYCNQEGRAQFGNASTTQYKIKNSKEVRSADFLGVRENFISVGLPEAIVQIIMSSWRTSTKEKYLAWGSSIGEQETGGHWNDSEINYHINTKEILTVYFSLKRFASKFKSVSVKLCIDNTTIVAAICQMGTSHSDIINRYTQYIWE